MNAKQLSYKRRLAVGAEVMPSGGVHFRVWAPGVESVTVQLRHGSGSDLILKEVELDPEIEGHFSTHIPDATAGMLYDFKLKKGGWRGPFPDPASRFQPQGPHGPSQIVDPARFNWTDGQWRGVSREGQVIYEMHIGTFTKPGSWAAAAEELPELVRLGVSVLEVMPVAEFPGRFGWGYDGVDLFAPTRLYGTPEEFRAFVNRAHELGLGVILDVVYNHLGPDGNYLLEFSRDYFTNRYTNEWGTAINFDGANSGPVREFFSANAAYWIDEFHLDGLRLDATQQIFDSSAEHILSVINRRVREAGPGRATYLTAENEPQHARLALPLEAGGYGLDALWNDDFHHSARAALTGHNEAYYSDYKGTPQEFISAAKRGFLYQGQWSSWQQKRRGTPTQGLHAHQFIAFIENHDQVANSLRGCRLSQLTSPGRLRAMTALLLLGPATPLLFQGQEFGATTPFLYFADHNPELARAVAKGRREFLSQFRAIASAEVDPFVVPPWAEESFERSKLDFSERQNHAAIYRFHHDLLKMRREDAVFRQARAGGIDGAVLGAEAFVLRFFGKSGEDRLLLVNLGQDLPLSPIPEPLLAPVQDGDWEMVWSSESCQYGGNGIPPLEHQGKWRIPGHAAVVLKPKRGGSSQASSQPESH